MFTRIAQIFLTSLLTINVADAAKCNEIKLLCQLSFTRIVQSGEREQTNITEIIEVADFGSLKSISPQGSNYLFGVETGKLPGTISVADYSDKNKWDIKQVWRGPRGNVWDVRYVIDRNTGIFFYSALGMSTHSGRGFCEKITLEKKKF